MHNGFVYLLKRDKSKIKILANANVKEKIINPNINLIIDDPIIAKGVLETINKNKLEWEVYAEPGTTEEILFSLKKIGINLIPGKHHPVVKKEYGSKLITKNHSLGHLPTGRKI